MKRVFSILALSLGLIALAPQTSFAHPDCSYTGLGGDDGFHSSYFTDGTCVDPVAQVYYNYGTYSCSGGMSGGDYILTAVYSTCMGYVAVQHTPYVGDVFIEGYRYW